MFHNTAICFNSCH